MKPIILKAPLKDYLWGGTRLKTEYHKTDPDLPIVSESWELSCHPDGESRILDGEGKGQILSDFLRDHPEAAGKRALKYDRFPILIKLIDAAKDLSIQVHPDNDYALREEHEYGKTECWYILDALPGSRLIYGFEHEISREELERHIRENTLLDVVHQVEVHPGDLFFIESGTLHGIGAGILLAEIQQNSNITYRVYDYGRLGADGKPRALHVQKALDVTKRAPAVNVDVKTEKFYQGDSVGRELVSCSYFRVFSWQIQKSFSVETEDESFVHLLITDGELVLKNAEAQFLLKKGSSVLLPAQKNHYDLIGTGRLVWTELN